MAASLPNPRMDQRIFRLGLPVETISAYLLCCALADEGHPLTRSGLLQVWNAAPEALDRALSYHRAPYDYDFDAFTAG